MRCMGLVVLRARHSRRVVIALTSIFGLSLATAPAATAKCLLQSVLDLTGLSIPSKDAPITNEQTDKVLRSVMEVDAQQVRIRITTKISRISRCVFEVDTRSNGRIVDGVYRVDFSKRSSMWLEWWRTGTYLAIAPERSRSPEQSSA
jgi:hypothetical protein